MKKVTILFIIAGFLLITGYVYVRYTLRTKKFTPVVVKEKSAQPEKQETVLDLRPRIIAKLQQLVKEGSDGLYNLSIHDVEPDILASKLVVINAVLIPDTSALNRLDLLKKAPNDVFKISFDSLQIDGIGINDFLSKNSIDLKLIVLSNPKMEVYHKNRPYNKTHKSDSSKLYQRLAGSIKHLGISSIVIRNGKLISHNLIKNKVNDYNDIKIKISGLLIDSTTEFDKDRFLYAKAVEISMKNYKVPSSDKLYDFKIGSLVISANKHVLNAQNVALLPRFSKKQFQKHIKTKTERYDISIPFIGFKNINWWDIVNGEGLRADELDVSNGKFNIYLDLTPPSSKKTNIQNYPQQMLMKVGYPIYISRFKVHNIEVAYEEFHPGSGKSGTISFDHINGEIKSLTNIPEEIRKNNQTVVTASGQFMNRVPVSAMVHFDLSKYKTGAFSADLKMGGFDGTMLNPATESMGLFMIKRGTVNSAKAHIDADNYKGYTKVMFLYNDLHITPLKKDSSRADGFKKKSVLSFVANTFVIKDQNPSKLEKPRIGEGASKRNPHSTFFNFIWKTTMVGILKTIGIPQKYAAN
ncbi:MAG TPA: hypothetical protein VGO09_10705 [Flavisolibacter sp.]|nr:hypothetical protein [Flavisolibacter sp.]